MQTDATKTSREKNSGIINGWKVSPNSGSSASYETTMLIAHFEQSKPSGKQLVYKNANREINSY